MKRPLAIFLTILLLGGCAAAAEDSSSSSALLTGETVSGIITKVNGNEITLDLVTLAQTSSRGEEKTPEAPWDERSPGDPLSKGNSPPADPGRAAESAKGAGQAKAESFPGERRPRGVETFLPENCLEAAPPLRGRLEEASRRTTPALGRPLSTKSRWGPRSSPSPAPAGDSTACPPTCWLPSLSGRTG